MIPARIHFIDVMVTMMVAQAMLSSATAQAPASDADNYVEIVAPTRYPAFVVGTRGENNLMGTGFLIEESDGKVWLVTCAHTVAKAIEDRQTTVAWMNREGSGWVTYEDKAGRGEIGEWTIDERYAESPKSPDIAVAPAPDTDWTWPNVTHQAFRMKGAKEMEKGDVVTIWTARGIESVDPTVPREIMHGVGMVLAGREGGTEWWAGIPRHRDLVGISGSPVTKDGSRTEIVGMVCGGEQRDERGYAIIRPIREIRETIMQAKQSREQGG